MRTSKEKARDVLLANRVRKAAARYFKREMNKLDLRWASGDRDMVKMVRQDRKDLIHVSALIRKGEYIEGLRFAQDMDTPTREEIPVTAWDALNKWG